MSQDLYSALSGAFGAWKQIDVVANNLANAQTTGFKRERLAFEGKGAQSSYARVADGLMDRRDGVARATGRPLDVALQGQGWMMVASSDGGDGPLLTRDGQLHVDPNDGVLRTVHGAAVMGQAGPIVVPPDQSVSIDDQGVVHASEDGPVGQIRLVDGPAEPLGANLWRPLGTLTDVQPTLVSGALEQSNVDPVIEMVALVEASRTFEMLQNVMKTSDQMDARLNEFGRG
ncbi:MAG: flagellar hook-basal body complex protein [Myxococcales bacterium]|nr:flagellar hook-basal body complex protein [Myxococcales bacterium]